MVEPHFFVASLSVDRPINSARNRTRKAGLRPEARGNPAGGGNRASELGRAEEASISVVTVERPFSFDGDHDAPILRPVLQRNEEGAAGKDDLDFSCIAAAKTPGNFQIVLTF
jgi:hypothetical protein